jgi:hypothetical protein
MIRYKILEEEYIKLQRGQKGEVDSPWDFTIVSGQHGEGVYAFLFGDKAMQAYYTKQGETLHTFKIPTKYIMDLSKQNLDLWKAKEIIYKNPEYKAFIFKHAGPGIPTSKEVLITDPKIIIL